MKKLITLFVMLIVFASFADTTIVNTGGLGITPTNVIELTLFDGVADTIEDSNSVVFGPYRLVADRNENMYKGFQIFSGVMTGTTPQALLSYQYSLSSDTADILDSMWIHADTLEPYGARGYVGLDSIAANFIYYKVYNNDATSDIMGSLIIAFEKDN